MLSLLLTLFISLFSICPTYDKVEQVENNLPSIKNTIIYEGHSGYATCYDEFACSEFWYNADDVFSTIWSDFTNDAGNHSQTYNVNVSGLYANLDLSLGSLTSYQSMLDYGTTNNLSVIRIVLHNRLFSSWSTDPNVYTHNYFEYRFRFDISNGYHVDLYVRNNNGGAFDVNLRLRDSSWNYVDNFDFTNFGLFCTDTFTLGNVFKISSIDDIWAGRDENYNDGYREGYETGVNIGKEDGYGRGFSEGKTEGVQEGYAEGLAHADYDSTALTIMQGIIDVGLLPVNVFLMILNFEVFGVNVSGFVSALLTISIVIIIVRFLFGGKNNDK